MTEESLRCVIDASVAIKLFVVEYIAKGRGQKAEGRRQKAEGKRWTGLGFSIWRES